MVDIIGELDGLFSEKISDDYNTYGLYMKNQLFKLNSFLSIVDSNYLTLDQAIKIYSECSKHWEFIDWNIVPINIEQQRLKARLRVSFDNLNIALEVALKEGKGEWREWLCAKKTSNQTLTLGKSPEIFTFETRHRLRSIVKAQEIIKEAEGLSLGDYYAKNYRELQEKSGEEIELKLSPRNNC